MATARIRGPAAPMPWSSRPASIMVKFTAKIDTSEPRRKMPKPAYMGGFRPRLSERGP